MVNSADFKKRLEKILAYYGLSATAFSETIDFNRSTISHLLSGRNKPSLEFVMKVVQHFPEVELYWLLNGKGSFPSDIDTTTPSITSVKKETEQQKVPSLPNSENIQKSANPTENQKTSQTDAIDRIVIFYKDGSFKDYRP